MQGLLSLAAHHIRNVFFVPMAWFQRELNKYQRICIYVIDKSGQYLLKAGYGTGGQKGSNATISEQ